MENAIDATLVTDIAGDVLVELAPQELPILPAASRAYFADPAAALKQLHPKDNALGFGVDPTLVFLTPIVLQVLADVFGFLTGVAKKAVEAGLAKEIPEIIKGMFRKFHSFEPDSRTSCCACSSTVLLEICRISPVSHADLPAAAQVSTSR
jgi:hypothetical protein